MITPNALARQAFRGLVEKVGGVEAAAALAATRRHEAVDRVIKACNTCSSQNIDGFYLSLSLARTPAAIEFLLKRISNDDPGAAAAMKALHPARFYPDIRAQTEAAVRQSGNTRLMSDFERQFAE